MRLVYPLPLVALVATIVSGAFLHADSFDGTPTYADTSLAPGCAPEPCAPEPCPVKVCAPMPKPCAPKVCNPCGSSAKGSFQSGFYVGAMGGMQHSSMFVHVSRLDSDGREGSSDQGEMSACSGYFGAFLGYLHRFCETNCTLGFEAFFDYGFSEPAFSEDNNILTDTLEWKAKHGYSVGGAFRPGYVLCEGHMLYGIAGAKWTNLELCFRQSTQPGAPPTCDTHVLAILVGLGWEMEFDGCHRIRFQGTYARSCDFRETVSAPNNQISGYRMQGSIDATEISVGYTFAF